MTFVLLFAMVLGITYNFVLFHSFKKVRFCKKYTLKAKEKVGNARGDWIRIYIELCLDFAICSMMELVMRQAVD